MTNSIMICIKYVLYITGIFVVILVSYGIYFILDSPTRKTRNRLNKAAQTLLQKTNTSQKITFIRHGEAVHNINWKALDERDAKLTENGIKQIQNLRCMLLHEFPNYFEEIDLIIVSPLMRTLQTMLLLIGDEYPECTHKMIIQPLAAERGNKLCDIGINKRDLMIEFPQIKALNALEEKWWIYPENVAMFQKRMLNFKSWIQLRPEKDILVISHDGVIHSLLSINLSNAELTTIDWMRPQ
eukprot:89235_1